MTHTLTTTDDTQAVDASVWCQPTAPHVNGCTCAPGAQQRCTACWSAWQHHVAGAAHTAKETP